MQIVKCEAKDCDGIVCWDEDKGEFVCIDCGALYQ